MDDNLQDPPVQDTIDDCWNSIGVHGAGSCARLTQYIHCRNCPVYGTAATTLFNRIAPDGYADTWTSRAAEKKEATGDRGSISLLVFRIGAEWLALPTSVFTEVTGMQPIHALPHRRDMVLGITNVRGEALICVSLGILLGVAPDTPQAKTAKASATPRLLVMSVGTGPVVFPVDEVHGILHCEQEDMTAAPATLAKSTATYTKAMLSRNGKVIGCLDEQLLSHTLNRSVT